MRKLLLAAAAAIVLATPASAQLYPNPFNDALQQYQVDQSLNALAAQSRSNLQDSVNRGLNLINPPNAYSGMGRRCPSWQLYC